MKPSTSKIAMKIGQSGGVWPCVILVAVFLIVPGPVHGQALDEENRVDVVLSDGTTVVLLGEAPSIPRSTNPNARPTKSKKYHYLPTGLRLSERKDGTPEFLYLKYTTETGEVQGGLVHFLMEWGLTEDQEEELEDALRDKVSGARLAGAASVEGLSESGTFRVISATLSSQERSRTLVMSGHAPILPGGKVAVAADLDPYGAQLLEASLEEASSIADLSLEIDLAYTAAVPAARGRAVLNWERLMTSYDSLWQSYESEFAGRNVEIKKCGWFIFPKCSIDVENRYAITDSLAHQQLTFLEETNVITVDFEERVEDERLTRIREAFFDFLIQKFTAPTPPLPPPDEPDDEAEEEALAEQFGTDTRSYTASRVRTDSLQQIRNETFNFSYRLAFKRPFSLVGNLKEWYDEVRHNESCVASVNLNDPFFENFTVRYRIDFEAPAELFDSAINHATVTMKKRRYSANDFEDVIVFDEDYVRENGVVGDLTFAKADDRDPLDYEYKVQWSFKGGHLYPENPRWEQGQGMAAVSISPPVTPRVIEVETDLDLLEANDITRVIAELAYEKFDRGFVEHIMLSPTPSSRDEQLGQPIVSKTVFMDRDQTAYAYRLIFYSKEHGRFATDWTSQVGETYLYAPIPNELLTDNKALQEAKQAARSVMRPGRPSEEAEKVLDEKLEGMFTPNNSEE